MGDAFARMRRRQALALAHVNNARHVMHHEFRHVIHHTHTLDTSSTTNEFLASRVEASYDAASVTFLALDSGVHLGGHGGAGSDVAGAPDYIPVCTSTQVAHSVRMRCRRYM